jgi:hypothetical protein
MRGKLRAGTMIAIGIVTSLSQKALDVIVRAGKILAF